MIYVDNINIPFHGIKMCHMYSDKSPMELHEFAFIIGLKVEWFHNGSSPYYYVSLSKKKLAKKTGAIEVDCLEDADKIKKIKEKFRSKISKI